MRKILIVSVLFILLFIITGCSSQTENVENVENKIPYTIYEYKDSDGCDYLIVYSEEDRISNGKGVGVGITEKVNQPEGCLK